jgi:hypothetical protein
MAERYLKRSAQEKPRKFFFINKRLHRILKINRPANLVEAWCYDDGCKVTLLYSEYKTKSQKAVSIKEAAAMLNIHKDTIKNAMYSNSIHRPQHSYPIGSMSKDSVRATTYWFSLENLLETWEYLMTVHQGRPRYDGEIMPNQRLPTRAELIARFQGEVVLFSRSDAEHYVPLYSPPTF